MGGTSRLTLFVSATLLVLNVHADFIYPDPKILQPKPEDAEKNCAALDREITRLLPLTYSNRPGFYSDPLNGFAFTVGSMFYTAAYAISGYTVFANYMDHRRIDEVRYRVSTLRRIKAQKHCFEDAIPR